MGEVEPVQGGAAAGFPAAQQRALVFQGCNSKLVLTKINRSLRSGLFFLGLHFALWL